MVRRISEKEANTTIADFKAVRSSLDISRSLIFYLSICAPDKYPSMNTARATRAINDILQGRSEHAVDELLTGMDTICGGWPDYDKDRTMLRQRIDDFSHQKELLSHPYAKSSSQQYHYKMFDPSAERPLKIVDQRLYDRAAKDGFPPFFFREAFFDRVTFYCIPDYADFNFSYFNNCTFAVCRIKEATFDGTTFSSCEFHSCAMRYATFFKSSLAHTHFHDSSLQNVSFQRARMKSCHTVDCDLENISFLHTTLDGCSFGRVTAHGISNLHTATITQGGATDEEVTQNQKAILSALRPRQEKQHAPPAKGRDGR